MPSTSNAQRIAAAIAEHNPSKLYKRNAGLKKMSKSQLHDYASSVVSKTIKKHADRDNDKD